jgi:aminoglycoside phosphotransferase (APT) family kinase protein
VNRDRIDAALAARLVAEQFPQWADLPVTPVDLAGWDNVTFRLGETMAVRLPSAESYVGSVEKELTWLPRLAPALPLPVPVPVAAGVPSESYPWPWSIRRWIDGRPAATAPPADPVTFAADLAGFLRALQHIDPTGGPAAGAHNFHRGGDLAVYDDQTRSAIKTVEGIDAETATDVWDSALAARWTDAPRWFHGDVAAGNLLLDDAGRLCAVIDFGTCGVGDPACDLVIAWTELSGTAREAFRSAMPADAAMWARARGWALWKALITIAIMDVTPSATEQAFRTARAVLAEHLDLKRP